MEYPFADRCDAGRQLAAALAGRWPVWTRPDRTDVPLVLGLPRGGVIVAAEVARALRTPLDALVVRKIGHPLRPEAAIGALGPDGHALLLPDLDAQGLSAEAVAQAVAEARHTWVDRNSLLRHDRPAPKVAGRTVIVVDDGIATGATAIAALTWLTEAGAARTILAAPVGPPEVVQELESLAGTVLCLLTPPWFYAVGQFYSSFRPTTDAEVIRLLTNLPST